MKHPALLFSLLAALGLATPATGLSSDRHQDRCDWHGHFHGPHVRFYGGWLPPIPFYGWPYYGYYGPSVDANIGGDEPPPPPNYRGARVENQGDDLSLDVQRALRHEGYYHGDVDGDIGAGTRGAIRQYQYDHHLEVTGRIDRALLRSLGID